MTSLRSKGRTSTSVKVYNTGYICLERRTDRVDLYKKRFIRETGDVQYHGPPVVVVPGLEGSLHGEFRPLPPWFS